MRRGNGAGGLVWMALVVLAGASRAPAADPASAAVPLGGVLTNQEGDQTFHVYVPTRMGGWLTVGTSSGTLGAIKGPDGKTRKNGQDIGQGQQGWYTFSVTGAKGPYRVGTRFVQVGQSRRMPWNYYYWPTKSDAIHEPWAGGNARVDTMGTYGDDELAAFPGSYIAPGQDIVRAGPNGLLETPVSPGDDSTWFPNEYDDLLFRGADGKLYRSPAPMLKYDQVFGTSARSWEAAYSQNHDIQRWPGHCLGGAVASIMLNEPVPAVPGMTKDELKGLWAELGENFLNHRIGDHVNGIPPGPPQPGPDPCDAAVAKFQEMLETHIRGEGKALLANLRAFPPRGTVNEVWNHGVGKYVAEFHAIPGKGARAVRINLTLVANSSSSINGDHDNPRVIKYEYSLVYGLDGRVDLSNPYACDWIAAGGDAMFAPENLLEVAQSRWQGHNPFVTEANVRALDLANGGNASLAANAPRTFRSVAEAEGGRLPYFAAGGGFMPYPYGPGMAGSPYFAANGGFAPYGGPVPGGGMFGGFYNR